MKKLIPTLVFLVVLAAAPASGRAEVFRKNTSVMGTVLEVTVEAPDEKAAEGAFSSVGSEMKRIEGEMSEWLAGSPISEVNRAAGLRPVKVPAELFNVISAARKVSELSGGAFDITWASMRSLWDFRPGHEKVPAPEEVKKGLALVDYRDIELDEAASTVFLRKKGMEVGLGAIAKGYAVDKAMEAVLGAGVKNAIIKAGGDIRVQGVGRAGEARLGGRGPGPEGQGKAHGEADTD